MKKSFGGVENTTSLFANNIHKGVKIMANAIEVKSLVKKYGKNTVLNNIDLEIKEGEFVCLLGPSGCGKSTLLRLIAGLDKQTEGVIMLNGKDATNLLPAKRDFGIVFQSYALFPNLTAYENVSYGLKNRHMKKSQILEICSRFFDLVGLSDKKDRYPSQLSGGEQQRVALARALVTSPKFLLLDEPLSALDAKVRVKLRKEICAIVKELHLTTIMVTHDQDEALTMADRIVVMNKAVIMQSGTPQEIYEKPATQFVADFIGAINFYDNEEKDEVFAIRPENIVLETQHSDKNQLAEITSAEFRGNFVRLGCKTTNIIHKNDFVVDMPYQEMKDKKLAVGEKVYVKLPDEYVLSFAKEKKV